MNVISLLVDTLDVFIKQFLILNRCFLVLQLRFFRAKKLVEYLSVAKESFPIERVAARLPLRVYRRLKIKIPRKLSETRENQRL